MQNNFEYLQKAFHFHNPNLAKIPYHLHVLKLKLKLNYFTMLVQFPVNQEIIRDPWIQVKYLRL